MSSSFPPDPNHQPTAPGEVRRGGGASGWKWIVGLAAVAMAMLVARAPEFKDRGSEALALPKSPTDIFSKLEAW